MGTRKKSGIFGTKNAEEILAAARQLFFFAMSIQLEYIGHKEKIRDFWHDKRELFFCFVFLRRPRGKIRVNMFKEILPIIEEKESFEVIGPMFKD